ncbi:MAG: hypothetical protein ACI82A_000755 [Candidatus Azotimanducaceae bacterium]|jgi:hypothetical protein
MATRQHLNQLIRYHRETLLDQIAALHIQIEENLENRQEIRHIKDLIAERQQYLNQFGGESLHLPTANRDPATRASRPTMYKE